MSTTEVVPVVEDASTCMREYLKTCITATKRYDALHDTTKCQELDLEGILHKLRLFDNHEIAAAGTTFAKSHGVRLARGPFCTSWMRDDGRRFRISNDFLIPICDVLK